MRSLWAAAGRQRERVRCGVSIGFGEAQEDSRGDCGDRSEKESADSTLPGIDGRGDGDTEGGHAWGKACRRENDATERCDIHRVRVIRGRERVDVDASRRDRARDRVSATPTTSSARRCALADAFLVARRPRRFARTPSERPASTRTARDWARSSRVARDAARALTDPQVSNALAGAGAGAVAATIVCPLDVPKTRLQVSTLRAGGDAYVSTFQSLRSIVRLEGAVGLYRGLTPTVAALLPNWAVYFTAYEFLKPAAPPRRRSPSSRRPCGT